MANEIHKGYPSSTDNTPEEEARFLTPQRKEHRNHGGTIEATKGPGKNLQEDRSGEISGTELNL